MAILKKGLDNSQEKQFELEEFEKFNLVQFYKTNQAIKYDEKINSYMTNYLEYMPCNRDELLKEFSMYCFVITKISSELSDKVLKYGIKYCREQVVSRRTGEASWEIWYLLNGSENLFSEINDNRLKDFLFKTIDVKKSNRFSDNPGIPATETNEAHREWWVLQEYKHHLARDYMLERIRVVSYSKSNKGESKQVKVRNFADDFVKNLRNDKYSTNEDVLNALKEIDKRFDPKVKIDKEFLRSDGSPYEKRICTALKIIFELKNENESIEWTSIRDAYRDAKISISKSWGN